MHFDFLIIGNGSIGLSVCLALTKENPNLNIGLIGPKNRIYSASKAAGAMINVFAEQETDFLDDEIIFKRFLLAFEAFKLWDKHSEDIQDISGIDIGLKWGTYIVNSVNSTFQEDLNFNYLENLISKKEPINFSNYMSKNSNIPEFLNTQNCYRSIRSLKVKDGWIDSEKLLNALDIALSRNGVQIIDDYASDLITEKNNIQVLTKNKKASFKTKNLVLCNGSFMSNLISSDKDLNSQIQKVFHGSGSAIEFKLNENIEYDFKNLPQNVIRTLNRGNACGLHIVPLSNNRYYLGATSTIHSSPEKSPRIANLEFLTKNGINDFAPFIGKSNILEWRFGHRPVSSDTFPLLGKTSNENIWIINGLKRDGLTCSPFLAKCLVEEAINNNSLFPKEFDPSRKLISYKNKKSAIEIAVNNIYASKASHGFILPFDGLEDFKFETRRKIQEIYNKNGITEFGIHPELINLYDQEKIKFLRSVN